MLCGHVTTVQLPARLLMRRGACVPHKIIGRYRAALIHHSRLMQKPLVAALDDFNQPVPRPQMALQ